MATKKFNFSSSGCTLIAGGSGDVTGAYANGFNVTIGAKKNYNRGIRIPLIKNFGTDDVIINSVTIKFHAYGELTSSIYDKGTGNIGHYLDSFITDIQEENCIGKGSSNVYTFKRTISNCSDWKRYSSSMGCNVICPYMGIRNPNSTRSDTYHVTNFVITIDYSLPMYYLDLNGSFNGNKQGNIAPYATCDVLINGAKVATQVSDYYTQHEWGSTYEINNIQINDGYSLKNVTGSLSGTITNKTDVILNFVYKTFDNILLDSTKTNTILINENRIKKILIDQKRIY